MDDPDALSTYLLWTASASTIVFYCCMILFETSSDHVVLCKVNQHMVVMWSSCISDLHSCVAVNSPTLAVYAPLPACSKAGLKAHCPIVEGCSSGSVTCLEMSEHCSINLLPNVVAKVFGAMEV
jgi:hypothetical protein